MEDLESRYFQRLTSAQVKYDEAAMAARLAHDDEVMDARKELFEKASGRFSQLLGQVPLSVPHETIEQMIADEVAKQAGSIRSPEPPITEEPDHG